METGEVQIIKVDDYRLTGDDGTVLVILWCDRGRSALYSERPI